MTRRQRQYIRVDSTGRLTLAAEELPALESGQVYVDVVLAGVCSTDEVIINSLRAGEKLPPSLHDACDVSSLGHEAVGILSGTDQAIVIVPAERRSPGEYGCMGLSASSHGAWGTTVVAEDWAVIPLPFLAPRFVLTDSLAPGFGLSQGLAESRRRIVVTGLGLIGLGVLWGLRSIGYPDAIGVDPLPERRLAALQLVPGAKVEDQISIQRDDLVVCALSTSALSAELLREWTARAFAVWCLTHPNSACALEWPPQAVSQDGIKWMHAPSTDHAAAVEALTGCSEADRFVDVLDYNHVAQAGRLPERSTGCLRTGLQFKTLA